MSSLRVASLDVTCFRVASFQTCFASLVFCKEGLPRTPSTAVNEERLPRASSTEVNEESLLLTAVNEERFPRAPSTEVNGECERLPRAPLTKVNGEHLLPAPLTEVNRNRTVDPEGACVLGKIMSDEGCDDDDDDEILVTKENFPENFFQAITLPGQSRGEKPEWKQWKVSQENGEAC